MVLSANAPGIVDFIWAYSLQVKLLLRNFSALVKNNKATKNRIKQDLKKKKLEKEATVS